MATTTAAQHRTSGNYLPALLADGVGLGLFVLFLDPLTTELSRRTLRSGMIFLVIYVIFAFGVNALKRLEPQAGKAAGVLSHLDFTGKRWVKVVLALLMVAFFVAAQIDLNQAADSMVDLMTRPEMFGHEGEITLYYSFGPIFLWLMTGVLYLAAFILPTERRIAAGTGRYALVEFWGLLGINGMLLATTAYLTVLIRDLQLSGGGLLLVFLAAVLLLEVLFDPPRLRHALLNPGWWPLVSYSVVVVAAAVLLWLAL